VTIAGIYEMKNPETVNFTREEEADKYEYDLTHSFLEADDDDDFNEDNPF
jgi:hypothetical protein